VSAAHVEARPGAYADSVTLMQISAQARAADGVQAALIGMATGLNLDLLSGLGLAAPPGADPNHLLIAIRARDDVALASALAQVDAALQPGPAAAASAAAAAAPRTTGSAARACGPALALVSVPGRFAFAEAMDALDAGCDVMIFSDNVPVAQEVALKDAAAARGLLVLGPDCGTAVVGGVGLGFSHTMRAGPIGLVAASGTGAQQVLCLLDHAGAGISAALGVGGRDLTAAVGGRSARAALAALDDDAGTALIVVLSKPAAPQVAGELRSIAATLATPVQFALVGPGQPDLTAAAEQALRAIGTRVPEWPYWPGDPRPAPSGALRGLFAGGTLCDEAMVIASERIGPIRSNVPLQPGWELDPDGGLPEHGSPEHERAGHWMIDFGDDALTAGRAHPMIDQSLRLQRLAETAADPATAVILLDVVLGHGAHADPAAEIAPVVAAARASRDLLVVVSLIGTRSDPQDLGRQAATLQSAGAHVFASNAQAARFACAAIAGPA
jgi:FdrA protein